MKDLFLLDPTVTFLNHGSFGACPRPVFEVYQRWQRELEAQPVEFLGRRVIDLLDESRHVLAGYVNANPNDVVYIVNATAGVNVMARAIAGILQPGDEVLTTDHEYGACVMAWEWALQPTGAHLVTAALPPVIENADAVIAALWAQVTPRTRAIYLSHITSASAITLPVAAITEKARAAGLIVLIDGAHVPAHIGLDLRALKPDFYTGNLHKWLCTPKGAAFLYVDEAWQDRVAPLYVSWGGYPGKSQSFARRMTWQGTHDPAAALTVPAAIQFQDDHDWPKQRIACHALATEARAGLVGVVGTQPLVPDDPAWYAQMIALPLPAGIDGMVLKNRLYDEHRIEIPVSFYADRWLIRASVQVYTTRADIDHLLAALHILLPTMPPQD